MAKLEGVKTIDMVGGEITKVEYDGAIYEKVDDKAVPNDIVEVIDGFGHLVSGDFGEVVYDSEGDITVYDGVGNRVIYRGIPDAVNVFRKVSESSTPTIEQVDAKVDALADRVTALEGEKKDESKPRTVKRKARVGERILITDVHEFEFRYKNGDNFGVRGVYYDGKVVLDVPGREILVLPREYEVIVEEESEPAPTFRIGDRVKALSDSEFGGIELGEIGEIIDTDAGEGEDDEYIITVETDRDACYFRPQDLELIEDGPYKPAEGDIVVITGNTNRSRNAVGDIGKVGEVAPVNTARVHVPSRPNSDKVNDNWTKFSEMRPATDEEKAKYERAVKFAELGRKPGEFKKGDIVRGVHWINTAKKFIGEVEDVVGDMIGVRVEDGGYYAVYMEKCELIAPVESRVDIVD